MMDLDGKMWAWVFRAGMKSMNFGLTGLCGGSLTFFYICRAVVSGAVSAFTYAGYHKYVAHDYWHWSTMVGYFVWGAIASLPGSGLVMQTTISAMKYWVGRLLGYAYSKFSYLGWGSMAAIMWSLRDSVNRALSSRRYYS